MTIEEMKKKKQEWGYTNAMVAKMAGLPLATVQKVFSGETRSPRYDTLEALEKVFRKEVRFLKEPVAAYGNSARSKEGGRFTVEDWFNLPDGVRAELIDGVLFEMQSPSAPHQLIAAEIHRQVANYIYDRGGACTPFIAPLGVQLDRDDYTMLEPDMLIVCDPSLILRKCIYGAPDFVLEVLSPSNRGKDLLLKLTKYREAGVREYWVLDPDKRTLMVYFFEEEDFLTIYDLNTVPEPVPVRIYGGELAIRMDRICRWVAEGAFPEE